jgi:RNA polymerase sigma-70 factor (ECF subfamily)
VTRNSTRDWHPRWANLAGLLREGYMDNPAPPGCEIREHTVFAQPATLIRSDEFTAKADTLASDRHRGKRLRQRICAMRQRLYRSALAWCRNGALADDLTQEAVIKALSRVDSLKDEDALQAWLLRILNNCYLDWGRAQKEHMDVDDLDLPCRDCPEAQADRDQTMHQIHWALDQISSQHRQMIELVDLEGFTYMEASRAVDVPIGTVMSRLSRGRIQLRKLLEQAPARSRAIRDDRVRQRPAQHQWSAQVR